MKCILKIEVLLKIILIILKAKLIFLIVLFGYINLAIACAEKRAVDTQRVVLEYYYYLFREVGNSGAGGFDNIIILLNLVQWSSPTKIGVSFSDTARYNSRSAAGLFSEDRLESRGSGAIERNFGPRPGPGQR